MLELDRFEQDEKKNDRSNVSDSVDDLKSSATLVQIEKKSEPVPLKDEETAKEQKGTTDFHRGSPNRRELISIFSPIEFLNHDAIFASQ